LRNLSAATRIVVSIISQAHQRKNE
jgi:hypothetical protein